MHYMLSLILAGLDMLKSQHAQLTEWLGSSGAVRCVKCLVCIICCWSRTTYRL